MDNPAVINEPVYVISDLTSTSQEIAIEQGNFGKYSRVIIDNTLATTPAFVVTGKASTTAVYPTSASASIMGKVIGAGTVQTFRIGTDVTNIAAIRESGTADLVVMLTTGE